MSLCCVSTVDTEGEVGRATVITVLCAGKCIKICILPQEAGPNWASDWGIVAIALSIILLQC